MEYVTDQYREEMNLPFRGASSVTVYVHMINQDAQKNAHITSSFSGSEKYLYSNEKRSTVTSTEQDGSMTFTFEDLYELDIAGFTIGFVTIPSSITITNGSKTETYAVNGQKTLEIDDGYTECHYIKITPSSGKLKINSIQFGLGLMFSNKQIMNTSRSNVVDHISNNLPEKRFSVTVDNTANLFNKDNPYGYASYLEEKQEITYEYGREMSDGSMYTIKGGKVLLNDWSSDDYQATFSCVGKLDYLDGTYYKGQIYDGGITSFDLAKKVFEDAGITAYKLDDSLKSVKILNPIPICEYREALKMIANASCATLYEDREGNICIKKEQGFSFIKELEFHNATEYSTTASIMLDNSANNYADAEFEYTKANGQLLFLPENGDYVSVGFVSKDLANNSGHFANTPSIDVKFVSELSMKRMYFNFGVICPTSMTVTCTLGGVAVDTQTLTNCEIVEVYEYEGTVDGATIVFNSANPNQRIHLNNIELDAKIGYELTYRDFKETPVASTLERVNTINVHYFEYNEERMEYGSSHSAFLDVTKTPNADGGDTVDITAGTSDYGSAIATIKADIGENLLTFDSPYYNYKVSAGEILESGVFYILIKSDIEQEISIYAQPYTVTKNVYTLQVHEKGVKKTLENQLIDSKLMAEQEACWLRDYYDDDVSYVFTYRGDPTLDADDMICTENKFVSNNTIRITSETINTSTGMDFSCMINARRTSYQVNSNMGEAIMGDFRIGEDVT